MAHALIALAARAAVLAALAFGVACSAPEPTPEPARDPQAYVWPEGPHPVAVLEITGLGEALGEEPGAARGEGLGKERGRREIEIELYPALAPSTVKNFTKLAKNGFYTGTTFHRVIPGFMIQGGDPNTKDRDPRNDGDGGPGWNIQDEFSKAPHLRGVLSMANSGGQNTGGSQFFILHADTLNLDGRHTIFGRVTRGMEVVDAITDVETDEHGRWGTRNRPLTDIKITAVTIRQPGEKEAPPEQADRGAKSNAGGA